MKFISGLSELEGYLWKKRQHKKYSGNIGYVRRNIQFDIKHGVTVEEVITFLDKSEMTSLFLMSERVPVAAKDWSN